MISRYLAIYKKILAINFARSASFRSQFFLLIILDIVFYSSALLTIDFLFRLVGPLEGWGRDHFLFFVTFMLAIDHLHMTFVSENFWTFAVEVRTGRLDQYLLKPVNPLFLIFFRIMRPGSLAVGIIPWSLLIVYGDAVGLDLLSFVALPFLVLLSFSVIVSLEIVIMTFCFWMTDGLSLNFLRMQLQEVSRWPDFVYRPFTRRIFTLLVPVLLAGTAPVRFLFEHSAWSGVVALAAVELVALALIGFLWRKGLRRYESLAV